MSGSGPVTRLIEDWQRGVAGAENALFEALYHKLHGMALNCVRNDPARRTLGASGLLHEAYLRFRRAERLEVTDSEHFVRIAGQVMRKILVDRARARKALKRDGGNPAEAGDLEVLVAQEAEADEIIAVDRALEQLASLSPRLARLVELRHFGGFSEEEAAAVLHLSVRQVRRDWREARTRLRGFIDGNGEES